nr:NAD-dependent epimerase/dehydratase family protein [uncultured Methanospirillum sp.]
MKKCLILGGNGFIGSNLARGLLLDKGYSVRVFCSINSQLNNLSDIVDDIEIFRGNFLSEVDLKEALVDIDYVFHFISLTTPASSIFDPLFDIHTNIIGTVQLFEIAKDMGIEKIIYSSSGGTVYGDSDEDFFKENNCINPQSPYAISKCAVEQYLKYYKRIYGLNYLILRYSNPYGEGQNPQGKQGVIPIFINTIKKGGSPIIFGDGTAIRDYIYIKDAVDATIQLLQTKNNSQIYNIGSGEGTSLNEIIEIISDITQKEIIPNYLDDSKVYAKRIVLDISKIYNDIGWNPQVTLKEGIKKLWDSQI